jgi:hypothetical protein
MDRFLYDLLQHVPEALSVICTVPALIWHRQPPHESAFLANLTR